MNRSSDRVLSLQIAGLQGFYWMIFCPVSSYASVYLLSRDFSNASIGWVMALGSVLAILLQPALGALLDRVTKISLKLVLCILSLICIALVAGILFLNTGLLWMAVFYVGIVALLLTMQPLVNALTFEYINAGRDISFGMTRAMGSICFAVLSILLGLWVGRFTAGVIPNVTLILFIGFLLIVLSFPRVGKGAGQIPVESAADQPAPAPQVGFLRRYQRFIPFLLGIAALFIFHTVINTFMAQIITSLGGRDTDLGVSLTIAAVCELPALLGFSYLAARFKTQTLLKVSGIFYALRSFIFVLAASVWMVNLGQVLQGVSFAVFIPASVYYVNQMMQGQDRVKGQTFISGTITLGGFFGSVIGGWLLDNSGVPGMLIFGALWAVIGCLLLIYSVGKPKEARHRTGNTILT